MKLGENEVNPSIDMSMSESQQTFLPIVYLIITE